MKSVDQSLLTGAAIAVTGRLQHVPGHRAGCRHVRLPVSGQLVASGDVEAHLLEAGVRQTSALRSDQRADQAIGIIGRRADQIDR